MRFDEMDKKMRVYEQSLDQVLLPDIYMVARLDGRGFTRLTKEVCHFEAPFDEKVQRYDGENNKNSHGLRIQSGIRLYRKR